MPLHAASWGSKGTLGTHGRVRDYYDVSARRFTPLHAASWNGSARPAPLGTREYTEGYSEYGTQQVCARRRAAARPRRRRERHDQSGVRRARTRRFRRAACSARTERKRKQTSAPTCSEAKQSKGRMNKQTSERARNWPGVGGQARAAVRRVGVRVSGFGLMFRGGNIAAFGVRRSAVRLLGNR